MTRVPHIHRHIWKSYGYQKRTDRPSELLTFYECKKCTDLKDEITTLDQRKAEAAAHPQIRNNKA
jgi:hypothetical protein